MRMQKLYQMYQTAYTISLFTFMSTTGSIRRKKNVDRKHMNVTAASTESVYANTTFARERKLCMVNLDALFAY